MDLERGLTIGSGSVRSLGPTLLGEFTPVPSYNPAYRTFTRSVRRRGS